jgi:hypothetical protein
MTLRLSFIIFSLNVAIRIQISTFAEVARDGSVPRCIRLQNDLACPFPSSSRSTELCRCTLHAPGRHTFSSRRRPCVSAPPQATPRATAPPPRAGDRARSSSSGRARRRPPWLPPASPWSTRRTRMRPPGWGFPRSTTGELVACHALTFLLIG